MKGFYCFLISTVTVTVLVTRLRRSAYGGRSEIDGKKMSYPCTRSIYPEKEILIQDFSFNAKCEIEIMRFAFDSIKSLTQEQRNCYIQLANYHDLEGNKAFAASQEICWFLPNLSERQKAQYCYSSALAGIASGISPHAMVVMLLDLMGQYGLDCMNEWNQVQTLLHLAEYHFEMLEFYLGVLKKA